MKKLDAIQCRSLKEVLNILNKDAIAREDIVNIFLKGSEYIAIFYCETKK